MEKWLIWIIFPMSGKFQEINCVCPCVETTCLWWLQCHDQHCHYHPHHHNDAWSSSASTQCYDTKSVSTSHHYSLSGAMGSRSWFIPAKLASHSVVSLHPVQHLPLPHLAFSDLHSNKAFGSLSWPIRLAWPRSKVGSNLYYNSSPFYHPHYYILLETMPCHNSLGTMSGPANNFTENKNYTATYTIWSRFTILHSTYCAKELFTLQPLGKMEHRNVGEHHKYYQHLTGWILASISSDFIHHNQETFTFQLSMSSEQPLMLNMMMEGRFVTVSEHGHVCYDRT